MPATLVAQDVVKRYGGVLALADGDLEIHAGEVMALLGANGSGKSTLSKIITGVVTRDGGQILINGKPARFASPQAARAMGIAIVFQELSLVPQMTVADNIWLTREPRGPLGRIDRKQLLAKTEALLALFAGTYKTDLGPDVLVADLPPDERQIVEILKAISVDPQILILDEATASLDSRQVQRLAELVITWKAAGKAIVFVSHRMEEIFQFADRYTVLRNGRSVGAGLISSVSEQDLVKLMIDSDSALAYTRTTGSTVPQPTCLEVENLHTRRLRGVSFRVQQGELLGIGGLQGHGQRDLLLALFGDLPFTGSIRYRSQPIHFSNPRQAMRQGFALVPGDRGREGLLSIRSILENFQLPSWARYGVPLRLNQARQDALRLGERLNLTMAGLDEPVSSLSGGNAQKVVIGKWLLRDPAILLLDDPTKGVDVGTKAELYSLLTSLCADGKTIVLHSSDDEELVGLCDRVLVLYEGQVHAELAGATLTKEQLITASLGVEARAA